MRPSSRQRQPGGHGVAWAVGMTSAYKSRGGDKPITRDHRRIHNAYGAAQASPTRRNRPALPRAGRGDGAGVAKNMEKSTIISRRKRAHRQPAPSARKPINKHNDRHRGNIKQPALAVERQSKRRRPCLMTRGKSLPAASCAGNGFGLGGLPISRWWLIRSARARRPSGRHRGKITAQ